MYYENLKTFEDWDSHVKYLELTLGKLSSNILKAIDLVKVHHDQPRTIASGNYNRHPLRVARILVEEIEVVAEDSILIALCHDLGEWTNYDINKLKTDFNKRVFEGVRILTWDQKGEWSDFVDRIVSSDVPDLIAIKIADKLDNNRAVELSGSNAEKQKAVQKTVNVILPLVEKFCPKTTKSYKEIIMKLE